MVSERRRSEVNALVIILKGTVLEAAAAAPDNNNTRNWSRQAGGAVQEKKQSKSQVFEMVQAFNLTPQMCMESLYNSMSGCNSLHSTISCGCFSMTGNLAASR